MVVQLRLPVRAFVVELVASRRTSGHGLGIGLTLPKGSTTSSDMDMRRDDSGIYQRISPLDRALKSSTVDGEDASLCGSLGCKCSQESRQNELLGRHLRS